MWMKALLINLSLIGYVCADGGLSGISSIRVDPQLVVNEEGEALIVWNTGGSLGGAIEYSLRDDHTDQFSSALPMTGVSISSQYVSAAMNHQTQALVVWNTVTGGIQYSIYDLAAHTMSSAQNILETSPYSTNPAVVLNDEGDGIAIWSDANQNIQYASYHKIDKSFSPARTLTGAKTLQDIQIQMNLQGEGLAVWYDSKAETLSYAVYGKNSRFGAVKTIAQTKDALNPSLVLNDQGEAILAWNTGSVTTPAGFLQYAVYSKDTHTFGALRTVSASKDGLAQNALPQLALNNKGEGMVVWSQVTATGKQPIWYAQYRQAVKRFDPPKPIIGAAAYSTAPQIAINDQGEMIAAWFTTETGAVQYSTFNRSTKGFGPIATISNPQPTDQFPQVLMNDQGEAIMVWSALGVIKYSFYNKTTKTFGDPKVVVKH